jgi:hypothetical protein
VIIDIHVIGCLLYLFYPLANEVAKGYSNATVRPSLRNILVNTLGSPTTYNKKQSLHLDVLAKINFSTKENILLITDIS